MKPTTLIVTSLVALTLLVGACAPAATSTAAPTAQPATAQPPVAQAPAASSYGGKGGYSNNSSSAYAADTPTAASAVTGAAAINVAANDKYKAFLVDGNGRTLYLYTKDSPNTSACSGSCAKYWPPFLTNGTPVAGSGVDASKFGMFTRADGTTQVTYNGWPLYYYDKDQQPGDITGDGVGGVWFLISPSGDKAVSSGY